MSKDNSPPCFHQIQQIQRALAFTLFLECVSAWCWHSASWSSASPVNRGPTSRPPPPRRNTWRTSARRTRRATTTRMKRGMMWKQRSPCPALKSPLVITPPSQTGLWAWTSSLQLKSWNELSGWRRGNGSSGRSGGTASQISWGRGRGRGLLEECTITKMEQASRETVVELWDHWMGFVPLMPESVAVVSKKIHLALTELNFRLNFDIALPL